MNLALLEQHAYEERRPSAGDWTFVVLSIVLVLVIAIVPFLLLGWVLHGVAGLFAARPPLGSLFR
jgi:hypothetical protein